MQKNERELLQKIAVYFKEQTREVTEYTFFLSYSNGEKRAVVWNTTAKYFDYAWEKLIRKLAKFLVLPKTVRIDMILSKKEYPAQQALREIKKTARNNYFPYGISFKQDGSRSFLKEEIIGSALLQPEKEHIVGVNAARLELNEQNLHTYIKERDQRISRSFSTAGQNEWAFFQTAAVLIEAGVWQPLEQNLAEFGAGVRVVDEENLLDCARKSIRHGSLYLLNQLADSGKFCYGYYPAYNKLIPGYNSVRHFSSLYALLEAYGYLGDSAYLAGITRGIEYGLQNLVKQIASRAYVIEETKRGGEIKLGAQAMAILTLAKFEEVTKRADFRVTLVSLLDGLQQSFITEADDTVHVLNEQLQPLEKFRIIYYDGEALFSLMRAYGITKEPRWLELGERLMTRFIQKNYQRYHDHWLSYSVNELIRYRPERSYFQFGIKNAFENLAFIRQRDTAYPTMLELLVAANKMLSALKRESFAHELIQPAEQALLWQVTQERTAHELRTGVMWPELALFFKEPNRIRYGFYTKHDRCRMRIDDAEHFLSGLINFVQYSGVKNHCEESVCAAGCSSGGTFKL